MVTKIRWTFQFKLHKLRGKERATFLFYKVHQKGKDIYNILIYGCPIIGEQLGGRGCIVVPIPAETPGSGDLGSPDFRVWLDIAWGQFDVAWPKMWHKNGVFDQILGCSGHLYVAWEKWAPVAVKIFYSYGGALLGYLCLLMIPDKYEKFL